MGLHIPTIDKILKAIKIVDIWMKRVNIFLTDMSYEEYMALLVEVDNMDEKQIKAVTGGGELVITKVCQECKKKVKVEETSDDHYKGRFWRKGGVGLIWLCKACRPIRAKKKYV